MNLALTYSELKSLTQFVEIVGEPLRMLNKLFFDSRNIRCSENVAFIALKGEFRDGHDFIQDAYAKGIRLFIVEKPPVNLTEEACFICVKNTLEFLQELACYHRSKFNLPIIAIAGSTGKTTVKEWIYHLLKNELKISRSPKSYNSQIGVALSLLEINQDTDLAIIEAGITKVGEMEKLAKMIRPRFGVCTNLNLKNGQEFGDLSDIAKETFLLFNSCEKVFFGTSLKSNSEIAKDLDFNVCLTPIDEATEKIIPAFDSGRKESAWLSIQIARKFTEINESRIKSLPYLANRLENFEGKNNALIINDCYNLDIDALQLSFDYLRSMAKNKKKIVVFGTYEQEDIRRALEQAKPQNPDIEFYFWDNQMELSIDVTDSVVLIKGYNTPELQQWMNHLKVKKHKTYLTYNLSNIRKNIAEFKRHLPPETGMLCMVKAQSYGSGLEKMGPFLQSCGINMLGVAYTDEGVELRKMGVEVPILVLNAEPHTFSDCIAYRLTPSVYDIEQLNALITELIYQNKKYFPIHIKLETGMNRLGFNEDELQELIEMIQAQPEIEVEGVFSHLASADHLEDLSYSIQQIDCFNKLNEILERALYKIPNKHILNTEGILNIGHSSYNMVRLGIGMYGITNNSQLSKNLLPTIEWTSEVSQIKSVKKGQFIGYSNSFQAETDMKIAIVPVGYADGFRRSLSNGKGGVFIHGCYCKTVGKVCMDMIMVDITSVTKTLKGDKVEIIGAQQSIEQFSILMDTIPYEVLTSFSKRVPRVYIED